MASQDHHLQHPHIKHQLPQTFAQCPAEPGRGLTAAQGVPFIRQGAAAAARVAQSPSAGARHHSNSYRSRWRCPNLPLDTAHGMEPHGWMVEPHGWIKHGWTVLVAIGSHSAGWLVET